MKIKKICFLAGIFPTESKPQAAVFYQNLVNEFAKIGIECKVIHPLPVNYEKKPHVFKRDYLVGSSEEVEIYRPKTITLGAKNIGFDNSAYYTAQLYTYSAKKLLKNLNWKPDVLYGHFISPAGVMAANLSKETGIPAFIAYGESRPWSINTIGVNRTKKILKNIEGFISVSTKNKKDLMNLGIAEESKVEVFPNAVNNQRFYVRDKFEARKKMGWGDDKFIVAYVGHFNERKGILRLDEALKELPEAYVAYAGQGELVPKSPNIIHNGNVTPELMPWFLSAADVFVLPTLNEGSCNAIIEAMSCGLPIISSNREFNRDVLDEENALLVEPESIIEIKKAVQKVMNDGDLRSRLGEKSIETSSKLNIKNRAVNILEWMNRQLGS
ncbi:glycosyltransferase [Salimicrobium jeotgali]|uniref:glycosyltransferase n=1 Tax=Salimicrobium jeotgali TaxID=1230341 RepID=UPI0015E12A0A|nr:glycosyltransferase [Salimicrobium jeotgali]